MDSVLPSTTDLPQDALVLVTDGTKPIALHAIKQLLAHGYRVRTTHGAFANASWLDQLFVNYLDKNVFERVTVCDPSHPDAFKEAVKGVHAIVHAPSIPFLGPHFGKVSEIASASVSSILEAAMSEPSVHTLVYTSSMVTATPLAPSCDICVGPDTWNKVDLGAALNGGDAISAYNAAMMAAEKAFWFWVDTRSPRFKVNVISPANVIGQNFGSQHTSDWKNWISELYQNGHADPPRGLNPTIPHWYVDVEDVALFHLAALHDPKIRHKRIQVWGQKLVWNEVVWLLRTLDSRCQFLPLIDFEIHRYPRGKIETDTALQCYILRRWKGTTQWKPLRETVVESVAVFRERMAEQAARE